MKSVFTNIYDKELWGKGRGSGTGSSVRATKKYIPFLENYFKENNISSVIDFGCGDWQFSQYINWTNIDYLGIDVVESVIDTNKKNFPEHRFIADGDIFKYLDGQDLIIIKDVLMHWPDDDIVSFLDKLIKYNIPILLVNSARNQPQKRKLKLGGWKPLEYNKYPLNKYDGKLIFTYSSRQVVLID